MEVREAGCTVKGEEIGMGRIERVQGNSGTEAETLRSGTGGGKRSSGGRVLLGAQPEETKNGAGEK